MKSPWKLKSSLQSPEAGHSEHHVMPLKVYFGVFGALLVLTVVTVLVSLLGLPPTASILVAVAVASVKAIVVALFFMHLISDEKFYSFILAATVFFMLLFFGLVLLDFEGRGNLHFEETPEYWEQYGKELTPTNPKD